MNNNIPQFSKITPLIKRNVAWSSPEAIRWQTEVASKTLKKKKKIIEECYCFVSSNAFPAFNLCLQHPSVKL